MNFYPELDFVSWSDLINAVIIRVILIFRQDFLCHDTRSGSISVALSDIYGRPDLQNILPRFGPFCMQYMGWSNYDQESPRLLIGDINSKYIRSLTNLNLFS